MADDDPDERELTRDALVASWLSSSLHPPLPESEGIDA